MRVFAKYFIAPAVKRNRWKSFCEVGASRGETADELLRLPVDKYVIIDPCFDMDLKSKYENDSRVFVIKQNSLDALAKTNELSLDSSFDCILLDGEHNWYTVYNEIRLIRENNLLRRGGYIFFHDVGWPYGRRDMYYQPNTIPQQFRRPYAAMGIIRGKSALSKIGGHNPDLFNATVEGGKRNGVLSAIEEFISENPTEYEFCMTDFQYGLGILHRKSDDNPSSSAEFRRFRTKTNLSSILGKIFGILPARSKRKLKRLAGL